MRREIVPLKILLALLSIEQEFLLFLENHPKTIGGRFSLSLLWTLPSMKAILGKR